jgi:hypothetical protein
LLTADHFPRREKRGKSHAHDGSLAQSNLVRKVLDTAGSAQKGMSKLVAGYIQFVRVAASASRRRTGSPQAQNRGLRNRSQRFLSRIDSHLGDDAIGSKRSRRETIMMNDESCVVQTDGWIHSCGAHLEA